MSKEKNSKSSKFAECYNKLRSNENLREELFKLSGNKFKAKLTEIFPGIDITGHFIRIAREIVNESNKTHSDASTNNQYVDSLDQDNNEQIYSFKEVASDKEEESNENNNDTNKDSNLVESIPSSNNVEKTKDFDDFNYNLSLSSTNTLNKLDSVIIDKNKVMSTDEKEIEIITLKKELKNKDSEIELLKSQLSSANEKINSFSIVNSKKQKEILEIQTSYDIKSNSNVCHIVICTDMVATLRKAYSNSGIINKDLLFESGSDINNYCVNRALSEAIYIYGTKS